MSPLLPPLLLFLSSLLTLTIADDSLSPGQSINTTQSLVSASGFFKLGFFAPGDGKRQYLGIWYNKIPVQTVVWVANRQSPLPESGGVLKVANNGSGLLLSDAAGTSIPWSISAANAGKLVARLLDTGNFVLLDEEDGTYLWQSFDHPTDALLPGMKLGVDKKTGLDRRLTSWKSPDDPAAGAYFMALDVSGVPEVYLADSSSSWTWRSGPWNGRRFSGIPEMQSYDMFSFAFVANETEDYYSFYTTNTSIVSRLLVNHTGQVQRLVWVERAATWNTFWFAPKDPCDAVSPCGPYGVCDTNDSPMCNCLQGFTPKSPQDWYLRDGSDGCVRKTVLDCSNGTDGFVTISGAKLPDTSKASADMGMGLEECKQACKRNCSCTAYAAADISGGGSGSGCILWFSHLTDLRVYANGGQDLFVRLAATDLGSGSSKFHKSKAWIIGVVLALGVVLVGCWIGWLVRSRKKRRKELLHATTSISGNYSAENSGPVRDLDLPLFEFSAMAAATDSFSVENKLGEGGFGPVYKGKLEDGKEVAIKRLSRNSVQGADEFRNEVMLIAKLQHRNLVRLLGCCTEGEERMLIYEYMPNTGLDAFLFDKEKGNLLDWKTRYRIIMGIARGLLYLHQDSRFRIIHRDLKASNILLDQDMNPRISDFGMARIFGGDETEANTIKVVGTYGYMAPEYALDGVFSMKSDVFSFGVLVLEIISGKRNRGHYFSDPLQNLVRHTWSLWKEGNSLEIIDKSIVHAFPISEALKCIKVGLLCVQEHPEDRPTMSAVVLMLGSDNALLPQPRHPGYIMTRGPMELYSSSGQQESCSINDITVTAFQGR